jgi:outer membrane receptor protein involved in Fe transport
MSYSLFLLLLFAQSQTGELRLSVFDAASRALPAATIELRSEAEQIRWRVTTDSDGKSTVQRLPFGTYVLTVSCSGFAPRVDQIEIRSSLPTFHRVTLTLAAVAEPIEVAARSTLLDERQTTTAHRLGTETLQHRTATLPGRALPELVNTQPGWLLEANGILHPRGSEYHTQYVTDGLPLTDNRSPAFAAEIEPEDVEAVTILTGGYPAEYGRKLGGVIEVTTAAQAQHGFHARLTAGIDSLATRTAGFFGGYANNRNAIAVGAAVTTTHRYLDPPVEENYTNEASTAYAVARLQRELTAGARIGGILRHSDSDFLVPNERVQQIAGQRQHRVSGENSVQTSYQQVLSPRLLADVRAMARSLSATLASNAASTPIIAEQDRGFRELYGKGTLTGTLGAHEWKGGAEVSVGSVRERLAYRVTDAMRFDADTPESFSFLDTRRDREYAAFVQDQMRFSSWTINAGLRWDRYSLVVEEQAWSPRVSVARSWHRAGLVARASYDRAFQTPAVENLLLASSPETAALGDTVLRLPVRPSRGNFYDAGLSKTIGSRARLDISHFLRTMRDFADDDVLLNTGVSFPIAFATARIEGTEVKITVPDWGPLSGFASYANMTGTGELPITGGLFLDDEAVALQRASGRFPVSQDQRNTVRSRIACRIGTAAWVAATAAYGSGLPVEFDGDKADAVDQYGERIVARVDFNSERTRPTFSLDISGALKIAIGTSREVRLQLDLRNVTNRLNVINFAGLFSGTALGMPRSVALRVHLEL